MLKIWGGAWKGRKLVRPAGIRPTSDKVRQAVFNILGEAVPGARVLDLYAGSGALAFEALSRGAAHATCIEAEAPCLRALRENAALLGPAVVGRITILDGRVTPLLARLEQQRARFDLVLGDPPYGGSVGKKCLIQLGAYAIIKPRGWVMFEHALQDDMPEAVGSLTRRSQHRYGDTVLSLYEATVV